MYESGEAAARAAGGAYLLYLAIDARALSSISWPG
jgi:hypothetical protein